MPHFGTNRGACWPQDQVAAWTGCVNLLPNQM